MGGKVLDYEAKRIRDQARADGYRQGHDQGIEQGSMIHLIDQVCKKMNKGYSPSEIADILEEEEVTVEKIVDAAAPFAPAFDIEKIYLILNPKS